MSSAVAQKQDRNQQERLTAQQRAHEPSMEEILASIRRIIADDRGIARAAEPEPAAAEASPVAQAVNDAPDSFVEPGREPVTGWHDAPAQTVAGSFESPMPADLAEAVSHAEQASTPVPEAIPAEEPEALSAMQWPEEERAEPSQTEPEGAGAFEAEAFRAEPFQADAPAPEADEAEGWDTPAYAPPVEPERAAAPLAESPEPSPASAQSAARFASQPASPPHQTPADTLLSQEANAAVSQAFSHLTQSMMAQNARTLEDIVGDMLRPMLKSWLDDNLPVLVERLVRAEIERVARGGR